MKTRLIARKAITAIRVLLENLGKFVYQSEYEKNRDKWYADGGENTKRIYFPQLNSDSIVFDIGGWRGDWASDIYAKYKSRIHVFEAVPESAEFISKRFAANSEIIVHSHGLGISDHKILIYIGDEGSSLFKNYNTTGVAKEIEIRDVCGFIASENIAKINLMKINIEGGEYDLLERIIEANLHFCIDGFLIQFHDFVENAESRRESIRSKLAVTHELIFDYPFVWESWKRRDAAP